MSETRIRLTRRELLDSLNIITKIALSDDEKFDFIEESVSGIGSILSIECDIELKKIKGKFRTVISGIETW